MKLGIIGLGNLGRSLFEGLLLSGTPVEDILIYNRTESVCENAKERYKVDASNNLVRVVESSEIVFLVVKGYVYEELSSRIPEKAYWGKSVVSFMAGVTPERLAELCPGARITVAIPTISIATCNGIIAHTKTSAEVSGLLSKLGYSFEANYEGVVKSAAYAACGLGFAAYLLDSYISAGRDLGFSPDECSRITEILFRTAINRGDFSQIVTEVATKGGATEQGVIHMNECNLPAVVSDAVRLAYDKMS